MSGNGMINLPGSEVSLSSDQLIKAITDTITVQLAANQTIKSIADPVAISGQVDVGTLNINDVGFKADSRLARVGEIEPVDLAGLLHKTHGAVGAFQHVIVSPASNVNGVVVHRAFQLYGEAYMGYRSSAPANWREMVVIAGGTYTGGGAYYAGGASIGSERCIVPAGHGLYVINDAAGVDCRYSLIYEVL